MYLHDIWVYLSIFQRRNVTYLVKCLCRLPLPGYAIYFLKHEHTRVGNEFTNIDLTKKALLDICIHLLLTIRIFKNANIKERGKQISYNYS